MRERTRHRVVFDAYVRQGPNRSLERLHAEIVVDPEAYGFTRPPALRTLYGWSAELHWQDRLADLEREARQRDAVEQLEALHEMNERHAREGLALQQKAVQRLQTLLDRELAPGEAIRALVEGVRLERLARGEVTERTQIERDNLDLSTFSVAELRALAELAAGRAAGDRPPQPGQPARLDGGPPDDPRPPDGADPGDA